MEKVLQKELMVTNVSGTWFEGEGGSESIKVSRREQKRKFLKLVYKSRGMYTHVPHPVCKGIIEGFTKNYLLSSLIPSR